MCVNSDFAKEEAVGVQSQRKLWRIQPISWECGGFAPNGVMRQKPHSGCQGWLVYGLLIRAYARGSKAIVLKKIVLLLYCSYNYTSDQYNRITIMQLVGSESKPGQLIYTRWENEGSVELMIVVHKLSIHFTLIVSPCSF